MNKIWERACLVAFPLVGVVDLRLLVVPFFWAGRHMPAPCYVAHVVGLHIPVLDRPTAAGIDFV